MPQSGTYNILHLAMLYYNQSINQRYALIFQTFDQYINVERNP